MMRLGQMISATVYGEPWTGRVIRMAGNTIWARNEAGRVRWFHRISLEGRA